MSASATMVKRQDTTPGRRAWRALLYALVFFLGAVFMFPFFWTISSSLKATHELYLWPPPILPETPIWDNYAEVFRLFPFGTWVINTIMVCFLATTGSVLSATVVAYSFARFRYPGRDLLFMITLGTMMIPTEVTLIPQFLIFKELDWLNTIRPLWIPHWFGGGAFNIFLLRQFIQTIPRELDQAALIDGAGRLRILFAIVMPLIKPALATALVISLIWNWSDFLGPLVYLNSSSKYTLALGLRFFDEWGRSTGQGLPQDHYLMAACVMSSTPILVLFFSTQRYFVQGIVMTGIKG
ncbi:MAG TPA: carbohydrate ABC transporter permease [Chloroflexi bacterium]|jgi:multiple sugar transport system permease protein|nr:carbohydrate ABC transporter permease [Chloroflexota bacterium]